MLKARWDSNCGRWVSGMVVERRIWRARGGPRTVHLSLEDVDESMARRFVRTWDAESVNGWGRENGVGENVSGVEAVDDGDDRGLEVTDETT